MVRTTVTLDDKYILEDGGVYLTGTQALARLPMAQKRRDAAAGLSTAGFISGYRGSPLGGFDQELWSARRHLQAHDIHFQPGVNEDLGATAVWGSQQVGLWPGARVDGVFGLWYGKGPGVDRSGDVFKHANLAGVAPLGGVLAVAGDDHASKSSTAPHQSEQAFIAAGIPVLNPATVAEVLEFGLHGWAMSRYAGCWVALKALTEVVDSSASVVTDHLRPAIIMPEDFAPPPGGLGIRWPDRPLVQEDRLFRFKLPAAIAYAKANRLDGEVWAGKPPRLGIVATGKGCLDALEALESLGLDRASAALLGIGFYKVGLVWPLEGDGMAAFARQYRTLLVIEEKRDIIEQQIKDRLYNLPADRRPLVVGKTDALGRPLLPSAGELTPAAVAMAIGRVLEDTAQIRERLEDIERREDAKVHLHPAMERAPHFCSGCPHNTSTKVPEGSVALGGIGCHYMATWMDRATETFSQMGGEGVAWVGQSPFTERRHVFANIGDGTYFHSGILAIRQAVAAKVTITYKLLYNDAVAMTGGQPVDGPLDVPTVIDQLRAEGVGTIAVVSNEPEKYGAQGHGIRVAHRDDLDHVQRDLRETPGVTVLIYDQTCAAEQRRRRKRGLAVDPARRVVINDLVCEGCGDCSTQSNCLSIAPMETEFGRKRKIDQSSCNKDFSCVRGFCPSFVTLEGAEVRKGSGILRDADDPTPAPFRQDVPDAALPAVGDRPFSILITGIGGTGVVTIGALIGMAAHIDGRTVSVLDQTGLAQKGGAVMSHVRIARPATDSATQDRVGTASGISAPGIAAQRIPSGGADALIGGDVVVSSGVEALARLSRGKTRAVINTHAVATGAFARNPDLAFPSARMLDDLKAAIDDSAGDTGNPAGGNPTGGNPTRGNLTALDATALATDLFGDSIASNLILLGMAWQKGLIPVSRLSLAEAIRLNGVAVETNLEAFEWGRRMAHDPGSVEKFIANRTTRLAPDHHRVSETLDEIIDRRISFLTSYQDAAYAQRYNDLVTRIRDRETALKAGAAGSGRDLPLTEAVARSAFRLMANKDEYEVARLQTDPAFLDGLRKQFTGDFRMVFHLAPPILAARDPDSGLPRKQAFGQWMLPVFRLLARMRRLRGTPFDLFGYLPERKAERALIDQYFGTMDTVIAGLTISNLGTAIALADLPRTIRGYGHIRANSMAAAEARRSELLATFLAGRQNDKDGEPVAMARSAAE